VLLDDPVMAKAMGERLRAHVTATFSWKRAHDRYVQLALDRAGDGVALRAFQDGS